MKKPDMFDPSKRYVFHNWSNESFAQKYGNPDFKFVPNPRYDQNRNRELYEEMYKREGIKTIEVPKGGIVEVQEWLAFLMCKHFVDREIIKDIELRHGPIKKNPKGEANEVANNEVLGMHTPDVRESFEEKTIRLIKDGEESPLIASIRADLRKEMEAEYANKSEPIIVSPSVVEATNPPMSDLPTTSKKPGRPAKVKEFEGIKE